MRTAQLSFGVAKPIILANFARREVDRAGVVGCA